MRSQSRKIIIKLLSYAMGGLLLLLVCLAFLLPKLINTEVVKEQLFQILSEKISGTIEFRSVNISIFPVPQLIIDQTHITMPDKLDAKIENLRIFPELIPLFSGEVRIFKLQLQKPVIVFRISDKEENSLISVQQLSAMLKSMVNETAGLTISLEKGSFSINKKENTLSTLQQVDAKISISSKKDSVTLSIDDLKIATPHIVLSGMLSIHHVSPRLNIDIMGKELSVGQIREFALALAGETPAVRKFFDIARDGTIPELSFHSQGDSFADLGTTMNIDLKGKLEQGSIHIPETGLDFTAVKGAFMASKGILQGTDIAGMCGKSNFRQASLRLDIKDDDGPFQMESLVRADLQEVFVLLKSLVKDKDMLGELDSIQSLSGTVIGKLALGGTIAALEARVAVSEMNLSARHQRIPLPVTIKSGSFIYDKDLISVQDLAGTLGQTTFSGLTARIDLGRNPQLMVNSGVMRIHAAEMHGWLSSYEGAQALLQDITSAYGSVVISSLAVSGPLLSPGAWIVNAGGLSEGLTVTSTIFPAALQLSCRRFSYDNAGISFEDLSATMGRSSVAGMNGRIDLGASPQIAIRSAQATVDSGEIYRLLASQEKMKASLREISAVSGNITLFTLALKGPVAVPKEWKFRTTGEADNLVVSSPSLPDQLALRQGRFSLSNGLIILDAARAEILDITASLSGSLTVSPDGLQGADVLIDAATGPRGMQWAKTFASFPQILKVQQRLSLARGHIVKSGKQGLSLQGVMTTQGGVILDLILSQEKQRLKISKLAIEDESSRASITLDIRERSWDMTFSGRLDASTVAALIELEQLPAGHLAGDFTAHILTDRPAESLARGRLSIERMVLPWKPDVPIKIDAMTLSADGGTISIESSRLRLADMTLSSSGSLAFGKDGLDIEMEIEVDRMERKSLERIIGDETSAPAAGDSAPLGMPIRGTVKLSVNEFVYDKFTMRPVYADIIFSPQSITAHIKKAELCNINVQGYVELAGSNQKMELTLAAKDQDLRGAIACLSDGASVMTGRFSLDGKLSMSPLQTDPPLKGLAGVLSFRAWDGRIIKSVPLAGIFSLLTATEYFRGLPDLRNEGLSYSTFTISGNIHQGILSLKEATIDSPAMLIMAEGTADLADSKLDIITLVAPFKTIDSMIKILPRRKGDNLASLVSIGVRVKGDIHNPTFSVQPLSGMNRGLIGVMERMLKAPVRIIELINPLPGK